MRAWWMVLLLAGCGGDGGGGSGDDDDDDDDDGAEVDLRALCEAAADCEQGTYELDVDQCVEGMEAMRQDALSEGCGREYRDYVGCLSADPTCEDGQLSIGTCEDEAVGLVACLSGYSTYPTYPYYTYTSTTPAPTTNPTTEPTGLDSMRVDCNGGLLDVGVGAFVVDGAEAILDVADTVNAPNNYYEAHSIPPVAVSGNFTEFASTLQPGLAYDDGVSSLFSCDPGVHYDESPPGSVMSYVVRAYDLAGLVDCFAVGDDAEGMVEGAFETYGNTLQHSDVSSANCSVGAWSR